MLSAMTESKSPEPKPVEPKPAESPKFIYDNPEPGQPIRQIKLVSFTY
jgi:hypothetical protein